MWWAQTAMADVLPPLPYRGEIPEVRWYGEVDDDHGRLEGRWRRRRDGEHELSVLPGGLVVRWWHATRDRALGDVVLDHQRDAAGQPWLTTRWEAGSPVSVTLHGPVPEVIAVSGWSWVALPGGGAVWAPSGATSDGDLARGPLLGGEWSAALHPAADPYGPAFTEGLLTGSLGTLVDRSAGWVDGEPGARHSLWLPVDGGRAAFVELWALPRDGGLLVLQWRVDPAGDPLVAARAARTLAGLVDLDHAGLDHAADPAPQGGAP